MPDSWIETVHEDDADGELAELYGRVVDPHAGTVDNIMKVHSLHPAGLNAHYHLYRAVMAGTKGLGPVAVDTLLSHLGYEAVLKKKRKA